MDDSELLEMAAKAAGIEILEWEGEFAAKVKYLEDAWEYWNPLTDDGDALRLAVKLRLTLLLEIPRIGIGPALPGVEMYVDEGEDEYAATRRAIVRAAAELARAGAQKG